MSYFKGVFLTNSGNTQINTVEDTEGNLNLAISMLQNVVVDANNSSTDNIGIGETWSGTSASTLGVVGLQYSLKTDQNCTIYVDQSPDGTNWDLTSQYNYIHTNGGQGWTTQALNSYVRVRVRNDGFSATTYFRGQNILCPTVEALPQKLSTNGRLKTESSIIDSRNRQNRITYYGEQQTAPTYRLVGTSFNGEYDSNFWVSGGTNGGDVSFDGSANLITSTNVAGTSTLTSVRKGRYVPGSSNLFRGTARLTTNPVANNVRRFGVYNDSDGFYFQVSGITFGIGYRKNSGDTIIENGSFTGDLGDRINMDTSVFDLSIEYDVSFVTWFINGIKLHTINVTNLTDSLSKTLTLSIKLENYNEGSTANNGIIVYSMSIFRLGEYVTAPTYKYLADANAIVLKHSAGVLHRIVVADTAGNATIYDGNDATGTLIAEMDLATGTYEFGLDFSNGLYIVTTNLSNLTVIYE